MFRYATDILEETEGQDSNNNLTKLGSSKKDYMTTIRSVKPPNIFLAASTNQPKSIQFPHKRRNNYTTTGENIKPSPVVSRKPSPFIPPTKKSMMELRLEKIHINPQEPKPKPHSEQLLSSPLKARNKLQELEEKISNLLLQNNEQPRKKYNLDNVLNKGRKQQIPTSVDWKGWQVPKKVEGGAMHSLQQSPGYKVLPDKCCCQRPMRTVWCRMCGFRIHGNIKRICPAHPLNIFLYEWEVCGNSNCRAPDYLTEIDLL
uniref:Uncharacterized protein n=2 Tax=Graphocephala atropunctata TaxID=36148 RepID=A0A1B6M7X3_9HEMI